MKFNTKKNQPPSTHHLQMDKKLSIESQNKKTKTLDLLSRSAFHSMRDSPGMLLTVFEVIPDLNR